MKEKQSKMILDLIEPYRELPPFSKFKNRELQTIAILWQISKITFLKDAIEERLKEED